MSRLGSLAGRLVRRSISSVIGGAVVAAIVVVALFAPLMAPFDPVEIRVRDRLVPPNAVHRFGTDNLGRDVFSQVLYGARLSLLIGTSVVAIAGTAGIAIGLLAGFQPRLDQPLMRLVDGMMAFPGILLAIALMAIMGQRLSNVIIAMCVIYTPRFARIVRGVVLVIRELDYVQASRACGASDFRLMRVHVLPNAVAPIIVQVTFTFAESILAEAALNFLGAGLPPDVPSWGNVIATGRQLLQTAPWITIFPGVAIMVTVLGLNLLGDGLRDLTDPRLRARIAVRPQP
ncbi:MAG: ABC transporter permease [Armatimonadota bacterium]|nr:ABC transporter permease [Armatimonadota bacterium]